jgi:hypothetical protein
MIITRLTHDYVDLTAGCYIGHGKKRGGWRGLESTGRGKGRDAARLEIDGSARVAESGPRIGTSLIP